MCCSVVVHQGATCDFTLCLRTGWVADILRDRITLLYSMCVCFLHFLYLKHKHDEYWATHWWRRRSTPSTVTPRKRDDREQTLRPNTWPQTQAGRRRGRGVCVWHLVVYTHTHALKHTLKGVVVTDLIATFLWDQHIPHFMDMSGFCESVCIWRCVWLLPH